MAKLRRLNDRYQITLPRALLHDAGFPTGGLYSIEIEGRRIILEPKEVVDPKLEEEDWKAMESLIEQQVRKSRFKEYPDPKSAKAHLKRPRK